MKRCLNCRQTYEDGPEECPYCGYKPRTKTKTITTKRFERPSRDISSSSAPSGRAKPTSASRRSIYAASGHSGAFYIKSGERLNNRYSVISVMGFGVFGVAYECFDNYTKQRVVVKEYMPSYLVTRSPNGRDAEPISEEAEAKFTAGCDSFAEENEKLRDNGVECVPPLIECFRQNNTAYAVTELIGGESLSSILNRRGKLSYEATAGIITSVLQGLRRLNRLGIIHGDICPENIIVVSDSETFLLDYNLSDFNKKVYTQRETGKPRPGYSALELYYKNMEVGPWTDVYAAAAVMYKMLTGITLPTSVKRNTSDTLLPLSKLGVPISSGAEKAMMKALKIDCEKRTQSPEDFLNGFVGDGFDNITAVKGSKKTPPAVPSRQRKRDDDTSGSGFLKGVLVILTLAIIAVVIWFFISGVFPLPKAVSDFLGIPSVENTSGTSAAPPEQPQETESDTRSEGNFYTESRSKEASSEKENPASRLIDDIVSGIGDRVSSLIDGYVTSSELPSDSSTGYEDGTASYYDDGGYDDGNYDDGSYDDWNYDESSAYDDASNWLDGNDGLDSLPVEDAEDIVSGLIEWYGN